MNRALRLAERGRRGVTPNPLVGCVLVKRGEVIGEGFHQQAGEPHAEILAIQHAESQGLSVAGASCYVTLEPCAHSGRTPPCADRLVKEDIAEVIFAAGDSNPQVAGQGLERLRKAGIAVHGPILEAQARWQNRGFFSAIERDRPWIMIKQAVSLDGRSAMENGESQWITGTAARRDVQRLRAASCAMLTGAGTVLADNPSLTVREAELGEAFRRQPKRYVLAGKSAAQIVASAEQLKIFNHAGSQATLLVSEKFASKKLMADFEKLASHLLSDVSLNVYKKLADLPALFMAEDIRYVMVEAGGRLAGSLLQAKLCDELMLYQAPIVMGSSARAGLDLPIIQMADKLRFYTRDERKLGDDRRLQLLPLNT